jgi:hypothetical protein
MIVTTTYDEGTVITMTMREAGSIDIHVNKPTVVDLDAREIRVVRN